MADEIDPIARTRQTYDDYAAEHAERFWNASVERAWDSFSALLPPGAQVLDLGCGAGRDVAVLIQRGFDVVGADLSRGLLREAQRRTAGMYVQVDMRAVPFGKAQFDGVWMCASLLHIPREQAPDVLAQVRRVMGLGSVLYTAVKQGDGEGWQETESPRFFTYYQQDQLAEMIQNVGFVVLTSWIEEFAGRNWVNLIARK